MILYHGSKSIIEWPEIRIQKYNKDFYFGFYLPYFRNRPFVGQSGLMASGI